MKYAIVVNELMSKLCTICRGEKISSPVLNFVYTLQSGFLELTTAYNRLFSSKSLPVHQWLILLYAFLKCRIQRLVLGSTSFLLEHQNP